MISKDASILVLGHTGLVGSAVVRKLLAEGFGNLTGISRKYKYEAEFKIRQRSCNLAQKELAGIRELFLDREAEYIIMAAGRVGGIYANSADPADFITDNLRMGLNVIQAAYEAKVKKLLYLGSSCIYPRNSPQPMAESALLTGPLEPTNAPYAISKIACVTACEAYNRQHGTKFICAMPTNVYGPGDNFKFPNCHVVPAMLVRFHEAKRLGLDAVCLWGDGKARREFIFSDDLADALLFLLDRYEPDPGEMPIVNVGSGEDMTIRQLSSKVAKVVGYEGGVRWDRLMPNGTPQKLLDISKLKALGWSGPFTDMDEGLRVAYESLLKSAQ